MFPNLRLILLGVAGIGAVLLLIGTYTTGRSHGYAEAATRYEKLMADQEAANKRAIDAANRDLLRAADELDAKSQELDNALDTIDQAATADPDGGIMCISLDGVRRLNAIR